MARADRPQESGMRALAPLIAGHVALILLLTGCAGGTAGEAATTEGAGEPIPIGVAVATTSDVALLGAEEALGAQIAERLLNERGGVAGRPIEVLVEDTGGDEKGAIRAFQSLINATPVVGIVGPTLSQQAFAADPIADQYGVPVLAPSNTAEGIPQIGEYIARVSAPVSIVAPNAVEAALDRDPTIERVAVAFAKDDAFASSETVTFQAAVRDRQLALTTVQTFQTSDTDFGQQVDAILESDAQLVIVSGLSADGGALVRQLGEGGYAGTIIGGNGLNTQRLLPICGSACNGMLIAQAYSPDNGSELNQAFRAAYEQERGQAPPQFAAQAFTAVQVFTEALRAVAQEQDLDALDLGALRTALNDAVLAGTYATPLGQISFTPEGELNQEEFYVARIEMDEGGANGRFVFE